MSSRIVVAAAASSAIAVTGGNASAGVVAALPIRQYGPGPPRHRGPPRRDQHRKFLPHQRSPAADQPPDRNLGV